MPESGMSPQDALVAVMVACSASDENVRTAELVAITRMVNHMPAFATDDPDLIPTGPWFQWHSDRWQLPPGATEIARNPAASQAFVLRKNLAVQFHPELTSDMLRLWLNNGGAEIARDRGLDPDALQASAVAEDVAARARAYDLVDAFLARFHH